MELKCVIVTLVLGFCVALRVTETVFHVHTNYVLTTGTPAETPFCPQRDAFDVPTLM